MRTVQQPQRITERERLANTSVAGSGGLFSASRYSSRCGFVQLKKCSTLRVCIMHAGVVTKAVHQGITQVWICTTERVLNPECEQYVCRSRYKAVHQGIHTSVDLYNRKSAHLWGCVKTDWKEQTTFWIKSCLIKNTVFYNPTAKKAKFSFRGTDMHVPDRIWSDL